VILLLVAGCDTLSGPQPITTPFCPEGVTCGEGFVVDGRFYGLICVGVQPRAVTGLVVAEGDGKFTEARSLRDLPTELWLAVRGDLPCHPSEDEPLEHERYLAQAEGITPADLERYGPILGDVTIP